jgi:hypothetical protein
MALAYCSRTIQDSDYFGLYICDVDVFIRHALVIQWICHYIKHICRHLQLGISGR